MNDLSSSASLAWQIAVWEAGASCQQYVEEDHIFIGICSLEKVIREGAKESGLAQNALHILQTELDILRSLIGEFQIDFASLRRSVRENLIKGSHTHTDNVIHRSESCKRIFLHADELAKPATETTCLHLLVSILDRPGKTLTHSLAQLNVKPTDLRERAVAYLEERTKRVQKKSNDHKGENSPDESATPFLDRFGRDLTQEASEGNLGPIVGRRDEILKVIQTLARSSKNNPVLVGEAGVGKTAVVEALALRIVQGKDPHLLCGKRIVELSMGTLVSGAKYRGEFEERLTKIIEEAHHHPEIIIFIDELHTVVGAGQIPGGMDAGNMLKPALGRGEIRCIGATTITEYRRYIESDPALERRFEKIIVPEPDRGETLEILRGLRSKWEEHHGVRIIDKALEASVDLSIRFDGDHQLPDKAIDLIDKAAARTRMPILSMRADTVRASSADVDTSKKNAMADQVTELIVAQVLSDKIGVPLEILKSHLNGASNPRILEMEAALKRYIIGQDEAIEKVCQRLQLAYAGLIDRRGPLGVFLFLGSSGIGKTEFARSLAQFLFGSSDELIRIDMSEFMEEHSVAKLIGSPPGYVGYGKKDS